MVIDIHHACFPKPSPKWSGPFPESGGSQKQVNAQTLLLIFSNFKFIASLDLKYYSCPLAAEDFGDQVSNWKLR